MCKEASRDLLLFSDMDLTGAESEGSAPDDATRRHSAPTVDFDRKSQR